MMKQTERTMKIKKLFKQINLGYYATQRKVFAEYGFPLRLVMCGKIINGRFILTNRYQAKC